MCGIVAYLGSESFKNYILLGLQLLQNRGYDSVGVSSIQSIPYGTGSRLHTTKIASTNVCDAFQVVETMITEDAVDGHCAIGHTRWATHGSKTDTNAHPHHDTNDRIAVVHNGIIENFHELKTELMAKGYHFRSQTDTEVISILIGSHLDQGEPMMTAIQRTLAALRGTWALAILHRDFPDKLWVTRNGSPLLLGMEDDFVMIVSEQIAFGNYIKKYIIVDNHDILEITNHENKIRYNKQLNHYPINTKPDICVDPLPLGYDHWMLKEIMEQPLSITRAMNNGGRIFSDTMVKLGGLDAHKEQLLGIEHLILLGCGTSYHAGLWATYLFKSLDIFSTVSIYDGAEFTPNDIPKVRPVHGQGSRLSVCKEGKVGMILLSQSGETKDLHRCIQIAKDHDILTIGVVNVIDSFIARETDCGIYLNAGREVAVASTKSFTNQCIVLAMIATWFSQYHETFENKRRDILADMRNIGFHIESLFHQENVAMLQNLANVMAKANHVFILGK